MGNILLAVIAGAGLIILLGAYALLRRVFVDEHQAYLYRKPLGELCQLHRTKILWNPLARMEKFAGIEPSISCWKPDLGEGQGGWEQQSIVTRRGCLSLSPKCCDAMPFYARTMDRHMMRVEASATVRLKKDQAIHYLSRGDIGKLFADRLTQAYREQIGRFNDEDLRAQHDELIEAVNTSLKRQEADPTTALGLEVVQTSFFADDVEQGQTTNGAITAVPNVTGPAPAPGAPATAGAAAAVPTVNTMPGAMQFSDIHLDHIADKFSGRADNETQALLHLIELQTRQNIVQMISQSNGLIIFTASELDLDAKTQLSLAAQAAGKELAVPEMGVNIRKAVLTPADTATPTEPVTPAAPAEPVKNGADDPRVQTFDPFGNKS